MNEGKKTIEKAKIFSRDRKRQDEKKTANMPAVLNSMQTNKKVHQQRDDGDSDVTNKLTNTYYAKHHERHRSRKKSTQCV